MTDESLIEQRRKTVTHAPVGDDTAPRAIERETVEVKSYSEGTNWGRVAFLIVLVLLVILFSGEPDIVDAVVKRIGGY